jgi:hypothetical protein
VPIPGSTRPATGAAMVLALVVSACGSGSAAAPSPSTAALSATTPPVAAATAASTAAAAVSATPGPTHLDTAVDDPVFGIALTLDLPHPWMASYPASGGADRAIDLIYTGDPPDDKSQWWGPTLENADGAFVVDPAAVNDMPQSDQGRVPWPKDLFAYLAALPGVHVLRGPEPVAYGGIAGKRIVIHVPQMHPLFHLANDSLWMGNSSGPDPELYEQIVLLTVGGKPLLVAMPWTEQATYQQAFDEVNKVLATLAFPG